MNELYRDLASSYSDQSPDLVLKALSNRLPHGSVRFSTALGEEDQVITHMIAAGSHPISIFTLDTGRLFQETYDLLDLTTKKYKVQIQTYFPDRSDVEAFTTQKGVNSFYESVDNRKQCCFIRKVKPLRRALDGASVWITGLRGSQSAHRESFAVWQYDEDLKVVKYNPLIGWSYEELQAYISTHRVPVNPLHKKGFASIGCAPCTRAIVPGEDFRAGRWWWENSHKECGLHESKVST
jgi:phosphoadenosine phosphosulfate reductase